MPAVTDASLVVAALFKEEHTAYAQEVFSHLTPQGLVAPALILWEVTNICLMKHRRGLLTDSEAHEVLEIFLSLPVDLDVDRGRLGDALSRARRQGRTAYDAAYLELAARLDAPLATIDKSLARAAIAEGLTVYSPFF